MNNVTQSHRFGASSDKNSSVGDSTIITNENDYGNRSQNNSKRAVCDVDTEYQPVRDKPTIPITVQVKTADGGARMFLHPLAPVEENKRHHPTFRSPFAPIDGLGLNWRDSEERTEHAFQIEVYMFFSFKDIEFLFADASVYRKWVLPQLARTRRISHGLKPIVLPYQVEMVTEKGSKQWRRLSIRVIDICAMQGVAGLSTYAENVGLKMEDKETYTHSEKSRMFEMYLDNPNKFESYATGDLVCSEVKTKTDDFYNQIAKMLSLEVRASWGMSTGKIAASLNTAWLSKRVGVKNDDFYKLTTVAGSKGITDLSRFQREKRLIYLAMVDGGRAVRERGTTDLAMGLLIDIDIAGCYGKGLLNQKFAVGNPTVIDESQSLGDFLKTLRKQMLPGLWYARISWKNAPFKQDLLISKTEEKFTNWDNAISGKDDEGKRVYDASMVLMTDEVHQASLNHDLLQVLENYSSSQEWGWLKENAVVESALIYQKSHRTSKVTPGMLKGIRTGKNKNVMLEGSKEWVEVDLRPLMQTLLDERKKHKKKTPMDAFLKLIINTIYGTIASEYFSEPGTGVSNVVVGNNITARARCLAWCMAKGLHSYMSVTDGGVFDVNRVLRYRKKSLDLFERVHQDNFKTNDRHCFVEQVPLMGYEVGVDEMSDIMTKIDVKAWQHLKSQFAKLDIFEYDQFSFESKDWYVKMTLHSKVDYRLTKHNGETTVAFRGMPKVWSENGKKVVDQRAHDLFDAIEQEKPIKVVIEDSKLLSLADWATHPKKEVLLPHDDVSDNKTFYSHTPLATRYQDMGHYRKVMRDYESAKVTGDCNQVAVVNR